MGSGEKDENSQNMIMNLNLFSLNLEINHVLLISLFSAIDFYELNLVISTYPTLYYFHFCTRGGRGGGGQGVKCWVAIWL